MIVVIRVVVWCMLRVWLCCLSVAEYVFVFVLLFVSFVFALCLLLLMLDVCCVV